jgi:hypothetical protein
MLRHGGSRLGLNPSPRTRVRRSSALYYRPLIRVDALETLDSAEIGLFEFRGEDDRREYRSLFKSGTGHSNTVIECD